MCCDRHTGHGLSHSCTSPPRPGVLAGTRGSVDPSAPLTPTRAGPGRGVKRLNPELSLVHLWASLPICPVRGVVWVPRGPQRPGGRPHLEDVNVEVGVGQQGSGAEHAGQGRGGAPEARHVPEQPVVRIKAQGDQAQRPQSCPEPHLPQPLCQGARNTVTGGQGSQHSWLPARPVVLTRRPGSSALSPESRLTHVTDEEMEH